MSKSNVINFEYELNREFEYKDDNNQTQFTESLLLVGEAYVYYDAHWGADADGNRGIPVHEVEIDTLNAYRWDEDASEWVSVPTSCFTENDSKYIFSYVEECLIEQHDREKYEYLN